MVVTLDTSSNNRAVMNFSAFSTMISFIIATTLLMIIALTAYCYSAAPGGRGAMIPSGQTSSLELEELPRLLSSIHGVFSLHGVVMVGDIPQHLFQVSVLRKVNILSYTKIWNLPYSIIYYDRGLYDIMQHRHKVGCYDRLLCGPGLLRWPRQRSNPPQRRGSSHSLAQEAPYSLTKEYTLKAHRDPKYMI